MHRNSFRLSYKVDTKMDQKQQQSVNYILLLLSYTIVVV